MISRYAMAKLLQRVADSLDTEDLANPDEEDAGVGTASSRGALSADPANEEDTTEDAEASGTVSSRDVPSPGLANPDEKDMGEEAGAGGGVPQDVRLDSGSPLVDELEQFEVLSSGIDDQDGGGAVGNLAGYRGSETPAFGQGF